MNLRTGIVTLLALGLLAWFLRDANFTDVWLQVRQVRAELLLASLVLVILTFCVSDDPVALPASPVGETRFRTVFRQR